MPLLTPHASRLTPDSEGATGLQRPFPPPVTRPDNPTTPARVVLGRLLFFDPILSNDSRTSCAHCHHPDLGFSDGLARARGYGGEGAGNHRVDGVELPRRSSALWNVAFNHRQYWDGRARDLEAQARFPITELDEMKSDRDTVVAKLKALPDYPPLFDRAFGGRGITFDNVLKALAAFERTLITRHSRFDRYAAGDSGALDASEKRGLKLFLSTKTRCAECHGLPTFANPDFKVIGVPNVPGRPPDPHKPNAEPGHGGGPNGAFKIPTLRNVALHPPYMHNGSLATLSDVLDFYSKGGGRGRGLDVPLQDDKIRKYKLAPQEKADLIAFLNALTDTSALPAFPAEVPSGLPVVPRLIPARVGVSHSTHPSSLIPHPSVVTVRAGQSIQDAVERAGRGGRVRVYPGVYHESILIINHGVTLEGITHAGQRPVLDGQGELSDAVIAMGNRFTVQGLEIRSYAGNGVIARGASQVAFRDLRVIDTGAYGIYPVECQGVQVEGCVVSGAKDAGIYVGQSRSISVRNNEVFQSVAGIEIENSVSAVVEGNYAHDNAGGILVFVLPFNPSKVALDCRVAHNRVLHNNAPNFADPGAMVANVLTGTGIMVLAAHRTEVTENEIAGNDSFGIAVSGLNAVYPPGTHYDVDPFPDENRIYANTLRDNGKSPDPRLKKYGVPGCDLVWDLSGRGNVWDQPGATSFPPRLPGRR